MSGQSLPAMPIVERHEESAVLVTTGFKPVDYRVNAARRNADRLALRLALLQHEDCSFRGVEVRVVQPRDFLTPKRAVKEKRENRIVPRAFRSILSPSRRQHLRHDRHFRAAHILPVLTRKSAHVQVPLDKPDCIRQFHH